MEGNRCREAQGEDCNYPTLCCRRMDCGLVALSSGVGSVPEHESNRVTDTKPQLWRESDSSG